MQFVLVLCLVALAECIIFLGVFGYQAMKALIRISEDLRQIRRRQENDLEEYQSLHTVTVRSVIVTFGLLFVMLLAAFMLVTLQYYNG